MIVQRQRYDGDCVTTALSMFLNLPYEDVSIAANEVVGEKRWRGRQGMWLSETLLVATLLARPLKRKYKYDLSSDEGVLFVRTKKLSHSVVIRRGLVFDPADASVWDPEVFLLHGKWKPTTLLVDS